MLRKGQPDMSRRQHVARTDGQGGVGNTRSLGGCEALCAVADSGSLGQGDNVLVAPVTVTSPSNYQRCFLSATIGRINAHMPDPPPPPQWKEFSVTFIPESRVGQPETARWISDPFDVSTMGGTVEIEMMYYQNIPYVSYAWQGADIYIEDDTYEWWTLASVPSGSGTKDMQNLVANRNIAFTVMNASFDTECTLDMRADTDNPGGFNLTISTGQWVTQEPQS